MFLEKFRTILQAIRKVNILYTCWPTSTITQCRFSYRMTGIIAAWIRSEETVRGEVANQTSGVPKPPALDRTLSALLKELSESEESCGAEGCSWTSSSIYSHPSRKICRGFITADDRTRASSDHFSTVFFIMTGCFEGRNKAIVMHFYLFIYFAHLHYLLFFICPILLFLLDLMILNFNYLHNKRKVQ